MLYDACEFANGGEKKKEWVVKERERGTERVARERGRKPCRRREEEKAELCEWQRDNEKREEYALLFISDYSGSLFRSLLFLSEIGARENSKWKQACKEALNVSQSAHNATGENEQTGSLTYRHSSRLFNLIGRRSSRLGAF
jgi:hypothetical protein